MIWYWALDGVALYDDTARLLHHEPFLDGTRRMFGAELIRPATLLVNLMGPMARGVPHVDTPSFRGLRRGEVPIWLLACMGMSGLFERWQLRVAGALSWFSEASDGAFDYWPQGLDRPVQSIRPPLGNRAILTDSDRMYHRVDVIGGADAIDRFRSRAKVTARSAATWNADSNAWEIVRDGTKTGQLSPVEMRISVLWKALVFADAADARRFDEHVDDLDPARIVAIFRHDLEQRGIPVDEPSDAYADQAWSRLLTETYMRRP